MSSDFDQMTPHDRDAELALLSLIICGSQTVSQAIADGISDKCFVNPDALDIWDICLRRHSKGFPVGITEIKTSIKNNRPAHASTSTLGEIVEASMANPSWSAVVGILQDRNARRIATDAARRASDASGAQCIQILTEAARSASEALSVDSVLKSAKKASQEFVEVLLVNGRGGDKITTGIREIDDRTGGIKRGGVWVFGGLPGRGKSVLLFQITEHCIWQERNVLVFSLELMAEEVVSRLLAAHGSASASQLQGLERLTKTAITRIKIDIEDLSSRHLTICDKGGLTIDEIEAYASRMHDKNPLDLIVIDYVQLCEVAYAKGQSREQAVAQVSRRMKAMAKRLNCGVVTASQLNDDGRMRESRAIKQDADAVFLIKLICGPDQTPGLAIDKLRGANPNPDYIPLRMNGEKQRFE